MKQHLFKFTDSLCHCGWPPFRSSLGLKNSLDTELGTQTQTPVPEPLVLAHRLRRKSSRPWLREQASLRRAALLLTLVFIKEPGRSEHVWLRSIRHGLSVHENPSAKHQRTSSRPPALSESRPDRQGENHTIKSCAQSAFGILHLALHLAFDIYSFRVMLSDQLLDTASQQGKGL